MCRLSQQPTHRHCLPCPCHGQHCGRKPLLACLILIVGCAGAPRDSQTETSSPVVERVPVPLEGEQLDTDRVEQMTSSPSLPPCWSLDMNGIYCRWMTPMPRHWWP